MSHFTVGVIVPNNINGAKLEAYVQATLAPFDEDLDVDPYLRPCYCVNSTARNEFSEKANALVGELRNINDEEVRKTWFEVREDYEQYHPEYGKPIPDCETCNGSGITTTTYNPNSKWDWYVVGGRWNRALPNEHNIIKIDDLLNDTTSREPVPPTYDGNEAWYKYDYGYYQEAKAAYDSTPADLRDLWTPFALITAAGEWVEKGQMGWFGMTTNEKEANKWARMVHTIYSENRDNYLVLLDCHI